MKYFFFFISIVWLPAKAQINLTSDLVICLPMNGNANDMSGNNNNGVISGATPTVNRFGTANSAYHFDGVNDLITIQPSQSINNIEQKDELTITAWCRVNGWYQNYNVFAIFEKYNSTGDDGWSLDLQNPATNSLNCGMHFLANSVTQPGVYTYVGATSTTFNQWDFYAATFSKSSQQFKAYKNGVLLNTVNTGTVQLANTNSLVVIGYSPAGPNEYSHGDIDEVRVYSRALTQQEITALFNQQGECALAPVSTFSANRTVVCAGQSIQFTDQSTNNPTAWSWQFPGGTPATATVSAPTVTFATPGIYTISLTASNQTQGNTAFQTVTVSACATDLTHETGSNIPYFQIFPNPANDWLFVSGVSDHTVILRNVLGQMVPVSPQRISDTTMKFELEELPDGLYLLEIRDFSGQTIASGKVIVR